MGTSQTPQTPGTGMTVPDAAPTLEEQLAAEKRKSASAEAMAALPPEKRAEIMLRRQANIVTAQIAGTNWGKGVDADVLRAVGDWGQRNGVDVTKEIYILGGNIYLNAEFYLNRLATLIERGRVLDWRQSFVNDDPRLSDDVPEERAERARRRQLRIAHNIPDEATSAVVTELYLVTMPHTAIVGVKWTPRNDSDAIGKKYPQESALTRSARRCLKQAVRYLPEIARYVEGAEEDAAATVEATLAEHRARQREIDANNAKAIGRPVQPVGIPEHVEASPVAVHTPNVAAVPDPYTGAPTSAPMTLAEPFASAIASAPKHVETAPAASVDDDAQNDLDLLSDDERRELAERARDKGVRAPEARP